MKLLDQVNGRQQVRRTFRLAVIEKNELLATLELDDEGQEELADLLEKAGYNRGIDEILDTTFSTNQRLKHKTRFSDGTFPVFYSSLEAATAREEVRHWMPQFMGNPVDARTAYYQEITCTFDGIEKDLREMVGKWPDLINKADYDFCNKLGAEAVNSNVDAFVTPSVRRASGLESANFQQTRCP